MEIKLTKLITNQMILGKTTINQDTTIIEDPYMVVPTPEGIQMFPYDEAVLGTTLDQMTLNNINIIYSSEVGTSLKDTYLETKTGIEIPKKSLIL